MCGCMMALLQAEETCPEQLAGQTVEMVPDGDGGHKCKACGCSREVVMATQRQMALDWRAGGPGYRKA